MGHTGHLKEEYRDLVERLDQGQVGMPEPKDARAWQGWREILEILYEPEEAAIAARLPLRPARLERCAERLGMDADVLRPKLDAMCDKGVVMDLVHPETGVVRYMLSPPVVGFFEFSLMRIKDGIPKQRMAEALDAYTHFDSAFAEEAFGGETVVGRAMVREEHIDGEALPDVLDWERASELVETAHTHAVSICYCRHKAEHLDRDCDAPKEVCMSLNAGAEFVIRRGFGRPLALADAHALLGQARDAGLVHIADNVQDRPSYICSCCGCCCGQLQAINDFGLRAVNPSGFEPRLDDERCIGCNLCSRACPVTAVTLQARRVPSSRRNVIRPIFDKDQCIGCGVCAGACRKGALTMVRRAERSHVPVNSIERVIRMSIERGRLAHLLIDQGESRGHGFLNRAIQAIVRLPAAERALASEQVKSRFVRMALSKVRDPSG